ncbi:MAG: cupredoxin domain-containing protein, partial [Patescibacteria group bacterium]
MKISASIVIALAFILGSYFLLNSKSETDNPASAANVSVVDGKQIIEINAKGGYFPRKSVAKAGVPTILRFNTVNTFDCSLAVRIPKMGISQNLPSLGVTDIELGNPKAGTLKGTCSMGMYPFEIDFQ